MDQVITLVYDYYGIGIFTNILFAEEAASIRYCCKESFVSPALLCYRLQEIFRANPCWDLNKLQINTYCQLAKIAYENYQGQTALSGIPGVDTKWKKTMYLGGVPQNWRMF